jgi:ribosomal protein L11 methyltransferase
MAKAMAREWVEVRIRSSLDPGELLGLLDDPAVTGAWEENGMIHLYWPGESWTEATLEALTTILRRNGDVAPDLLSVDLLPDRDWNEQWARSVKPIRIGRRFVIRPSWESVVLEPGQIELILDPKQAFGTGHHATTRLLLEWLEDLIHGGERILDVGTGSGILAMAALRLGAGSATAIDHDQVAIDCAQGYAQQNGFGRELDLRAVPLEALATFEGNRTFTLITANLDRGTLLANAPLLATHLERGARLLLSGLLKEDRADIAAAYGLVGGSVRDCREREGWVALEILGPESCDGGG